MEELWSCAREWSWSEDYQMEMFRVPFSFSSRKQSPGCGDSGVLNTGGPCSRSAD